MTYTSLDASRNIVFFLHPLLLHPYSCLKLYFATSLSMRFFKLLTDIFVPDRWKISLLFDDPKAFRRRPFGPIILPFFLFFFLLSFMQFLRYLGIKDTSSSNLSRFSPRYCSKLEKIEIIR